MAGKKYLDSSGLVTYDGLIKKHISGKFTDSTATFAGKASKSSDSEKLGGVAPASYVKTVKVGNASYSPSSSEVSLPAYPTLSSLGAAKDASLTAHTGNSTIHITAAERTKWNGYSTTINALQNKDTSLDSSLKVVDSSLKTHLNDNTRHITAAERTRWNNTYTKSELDSSYSDLDTKLTNQFDKIDGRFDGLEDKVSTHDAEIMNLTGYFSNIGSDLTALSGKVTAMGNVFKFKGTKAKKSDLPSSGNEIGDVWHVNEDSNEYVYDASSKWELIGSAHTQVSAVASLNSGTKVGTVTVDGTTTTFYAPTPSITQVSADASLTSGTRIGTISVNNKSTVLYAPSKTSVTVTQNATSGINVGTIDVDGVSKTLYITNPNTDSKVKHTDPGKVTTKYPLLMGKTNGTATEEVYHTPNITVDSSNGAIYGKQYCVGSLSNDALNSRVTNKSTTSPQVMSLYSGGNELNLVYNSASEAGILWINYGKSDLGQTPTAFKWMTGGGNNNKCASHVLGSVYSYNTDIILNASTNESLLSYCPSNDYAANNSIVLGSGSRAITLATDDNSAVYHGTAGGHLYEMWDSKNLNIARGVNLLHGTYSPSDVFTGSSSASDSTYGRIMTCKYTGSSDYTDVTYTHPLKLKNGGVYIISFYVKADAAFTGTTTLTAATGIYTHFYNTDQTNSGYLVASVRTSWGVNNTAGDGLAANLPFTTAWKQVYITYKLTNNVENTSCNPSFILFRIGKGCTHTIYVADIQIEEGVTTPSDYSEVGMGDLAPVNADMCDLGTEGHAWRNIHAGILHLAKGDEGEHGSAAWGGMLAFGDSYKVLEGSTLPYTYIREVDDDNLEIKGGTSVTIFGGDEVIIRNNYGTTLSTNDYGECTINGSALNFIATDGEILVSGSTSINGSCSASAGFFETSDIRKKNILSELPIEKCYELVDKCQEIVYTLKSDPDKERVGMIAQEVECFFPEIISEGADGYKSLDYAKLSVVCLRLLKDIIEKGGYKPKTFTEKVKSKFKKIFSKR